MSKAPKTRNTWSDLQKTALSNARKAKAKENLTMAQTIERYRAESGDATRTDAAITTALYAKPKLPKAVPAKGSKRSAKASNTVGAVEHILKGTKGPLEAKRSILNDGNALDLVGGVLDLLGSQVITKGEAADLILRVQKSL